MFNYLAVNMATGGWSTEDLENALSMVKEQHMSFREAAQTYGIPKSTLHDHYSGKVKGCKTGPSPYLTEAEEQQLADWAIEMGKIGYGCTREQISLMVQKPLDKDGRQNPFLNNRPGKDWWYAFLRRHPELAMRSPEPLQLARASACSEEILSRWYTAFKQFLEVNDLNDPARIWNADETGCPLCPKSGKVLALSGAKNVYQVTSDTKEQITTLCAISAAGNIIPPMHIFSGQRFRYNPLDGCVTGAYFGKSEKGWITKELFYGWLANHFISHIPPSRPVVLLVDGHSTHIDLETSKLCQEKGILLYCLPAHSSHITQPLDVGFYGPLKQAWKKAVANYTANNFGKSETKQTFARVFKEAWQNTVKVSTIENSFHNSGIYPVDFSALRGTKLVPSTIYRFEQVPPSQSSPAQDLSTGQVGKQSEVALEALEKAMDKETKETFAVRYEEGYDLETDQLYVVWAKLKALSIDDKDDDENGDGLKQKSAEPQQKDGMAKQGRKAPAEQTRESSEERERLEQEKGKVDRESQEKASRKSVRKGRKKAVARAGERREEQRRLELERVEGEKENESRDSQGKIGDEKEGRKTSAETTEQVGLGRKKAKKSQTKDSQKGTEPASDVLAEILVYPKPITRKKTKAGTSDSLPYLW